jgi:hypothetical protein
MPGPVPGSFAASSRTTAAAMMAAVWLRKTSHCRNASAAVQDAPTSITGIGKA